MFKVQYKESEFNVSFQHPTSDGETVRRGTVCTVEGPEGAVIGISICHPEDNFDRSVGRKRALTRALAPFEKEFRTAVWSEYFRRHNK